jgi:hypothetical protein
MILLWFAAAVICLIGVVLLWLGRGAPSEKQKDMGTFANYFTYVNEDGTARELTPDEKDYLNTRFYPSDSGRPYIKGSYHQTTPDGKISGYLLKNSLPRYMRPQG